MERTLVLLKPDCVQRRLMGRVLARMEDKGLNVVAMKMLRITPELAKKRGQRPSARDPPRPAAQGATSARKRRMRAR